MANHLEQTWRWFGPQDPIPLAHIRQAGATGIVTALHHIPNGAVWSVAEIAQRKQMIEQADLRWSVVESVPVHEDIKQQTGNWQVYIAHYQETLRNLSACGISTVCYNFMPVLDWTRTDLHFRVEDGSEALRFDKVALAAFDVHILKRPNAAQDYDALILEQAEKYFQQLDSEALTRVKANILAGLPGSEESYSLEDFRQKLAAYANIDADKLRAHLLDFIRAVAPVAEEVGIRLAIHPDDPPFPLFGLPRVVSTCADIEAIYNAYHSDYNGLCFCTGSFGARADQDLPAMFRQLGRRVNFLHLRSVQLEPDGSFYEANHLEGSHDVYHIMLEIIKEQQRRTAPIPMRPDHGHRMLDDLHKTVNPGYSAVGRLRGLAELRGLEMGIRRSLFN
ncbi:MAG: mannonate dehydratase [Saprospiraceae bacterium]